MSGTPNLFGRTKIYTDVEEITRDNVLEVLSKALFTHAANRAEIQYLYDYYKGNQPILQRVKEIRPEICNKIVENRANEIVSFKVGYLMGEPVQYVSRAGEVDYTKGIGALNNFMFEEDKASKDEELADWFTICGTAYRMILPVVTPDPNEAPFEIFTLDPRNTFCVYYSGPGNKPVMGVRYVLKSTGVTVYSVYTATEYYEIETGAGADGLGITKAEAHIFGGIPIIEYPANNARLGAFEIVLPLLDAINKVDSNRLDGVEQFVQALMVLKGVNIEDEDFAKVKELGGILVPKDGDVSYLVQQLNQTETQTLKNDMYQSVLVICGMPNRNGGSSTSDTGKAVIMRDGWSDAEARAKRTEGMFRRSEKLFLRIALEIMSTLRRIDLPLYAVDIRFTRRNYDNILTKAQVLTSMLANEKIDPLLAFQYCGMFVDPDLAYAMSKQYYEEIMAKRAKELDELDE